MSGYSTNQYQSRSTRRGRDQGRACGSNGPNSSGRGACNSNKKNKNPVSQKSIKKQQRRDELAQQAAAKEAAREATLLQQEQRIKELEALVKQSQGVVTKAEEHVSSKDDAQQWQSSWWYSWDDWNINGSRDMVK